GTRPVPTRPDATTAPPRHVLLVEDNATNAEVIRAALRTRPWVALQVATTVKEALASLHTQGAARPELILLDMNLPDAPGLSMLQRVRAQPETQGIPVIVISADAMPEQIDAALAAGASCYLTKPVQMPALLQQIDEFLPAR
ncbi:MAG: response regulator, partial [Aquabacterium sp.]